MLSIELLYADENYDTPREGEDYGVQLAGKFAQIDEEVSIEYTNVGHGAAFPMFLVQLFQGIDWSTLAFTTGPIGLFLLGERIDRNLEAWLRIATRLRSVVAKVKPDRIDELAAFLQCLGKLDRTDLTGHVRASIQVLEGNPVPQGRFRLDRRPDALYLITIQSTEVCHIFVVDSRGNTRFEEPYAMSWFEFATEVRLEPERPGTESTSHN